MTIKNALIIALAVMGTSFAILAQDAEPDFKCLAFEKNTGDYKDRLYLVIGGDSVSGNQSLESDSGSLSGKVFGKVLKDGVLHLTFFYENDGGEPGAEEQLMKLGKDEIAIAEGELEEHGPNQKTLKDPKNVKFTKVFKQLPLSLPELESKEAAVVLKPVHALVEKLTGLNCDLSGGRLRVAGNVALFQGYLSAPEGKKPSDPHIAAKMLDGEFQVFLKKDDKGWAVARSGFISMSGSSDYQGVSEEDAPWQLLNGGEMH